jgi:selenide,water dikinase
VIFASLMQGRSKPDWLEAAIDSMLRSNRHVAELTAHVSVSAMTDVTGFGLAGHLGEMVRGEQLAARLYLDDLPSLPGALNLFSETAIESSLAIHNEAAVEDLLVVDHSSLSQDARYRLLFDPQTSGGLLVSLPEQAVETFLSQLSSIGEIEARCIGDIVEGRGIQVCADRKSLH